MVRNSVRTLKGLRGPWGDDVWVAIVDETEAVHRFVPFVEQLFEESGSGGMMTMEKVEIVRYTSGT
jgi:PII-like signaling protein